SPYSPLFFFFFFFNAPPTTYFYTLSLHDALPIYFSGGRLHAHVAFLVEQHRVEVAESEILSLVTVALHLAIDGLDHIPAVAFVRRFLNRGVVDKRVGQPFAGDLQELLGSADDRPGWFPAAHIVAAAVVDNDPRFVGKNELIGAIKNILGHRAAKSVVEHRQRRHLFAQMRPKSEDAAAYKEDAALRRWVRLVAGEHLLDLALKTLRVERGGDAHGGGQAGHGAQRAAMNVHMGYAASSSGVTAARVLVRG